MEPEPEEPAVVVADGAKTAANLLMPPQMNDGGHSEHLIRPERLRGSAGCEHSQYAPPLWSTSLGDPHGQWLKRDAAARRKLKVSRSMDAEKERVTNECLLRLESRLRELVYGKIEGHQFDSLSKSWQRMPRGSYELKHKSQLAPEGRDVLHRVLSEAAGGHALTLKQFRTALEHELGLDPPLTEQEAAAWMMKVGHDGQGRMPIDVFVRRLFTGEAHVMSLEGARQGAFPRDKTRRYEDYCWAWQGMIKNAPRFAKSGVYTPSDWEDYCSKACKIEERGPPEAYLKLEHVHGFSGLLNTSNNLFYSVRTAAGGVQSSCLVYYAAAVGIAYSYDETDPARAEGEKEKQKFFLKHDDDISAIAMHPGRQIVASGQKCGPVYLWDESSRSGPHGGREAIRLDLPEKQGLSCLSFSQFGHGRHAPEPGDLLLTVSRDPDHTLRVWHWRKQTGASSCSAVGMKGTPPQVYGCAWNPFHSSAGYGNCHRSTFATFGKMHVMFWDYEELPDDTPTGAEAQGGIRARISPKAAMFGTRSDEAAKQDVLCLCYLPMNAVLVGGPNGSITVLSHPEERLDDDAHTAAVRERALERKFLRGGSEADRAAAEASMAKLHLRKQLKTLAVQEIRHAHAAGVPIEPGTNTGQWGIVSGGCTALVLAKTQDVVFSGGGDGRIIEWQIDIGEMVTPAEWRGPQPVLKMAAGVDIITPLRVFDARTKDRTGPPRMFVGMDCWDFKRGGSETQRKVCAGDTENDIWEIVQTSTSDSEPAFESDVAGSLEKESNFLLEGQSEAVCGIAPFPDKGGLAQIYATACEDGHVYVFDADTRSHLRKLEIRREGGVDGKHVPPRCSAGDLLKARSCAFSPCGKMLAVGTSGVRQFAERVTVKVPETEWAKAGQKVFIKLSRDRRGVVEKIEAVETEPSGGDDFFEYTLPKGTRPMMELSIDVPLEYVKQKGGFGEMCYRSDEDLGGTLQVWQFEGQPQQGHGWAKKDDIEDEDFVPPTLLFEEKICIEEIDVLRFSPDSTMVAAGSHDNYVYVIGLECTGGVHRWSAPVDTEGIETPPTEAPPKQPAAMPTEHGYTRQDDGAVVISASDQATLDQMLLQRVIAKRTRDFAQADQLRDQLREAGCMVDDKMSTYRIVPRFERVGVCACHSSYIKHVDWSEQVDDEGGKQQEPLLLQSTCGAYETLFYKPEPDRDKRMSSKMLTLPNGEVWPVCEQICINQRDTIWSTWTSTLGFPVMGIWGASQKDGTDINACDRSPLLKSKSMRDIVTEREPRTRTPKDEVSRDMPCLVTANDDGTVGLFHYPSVLAASPHHSFRGHASHVMSVRFLSDATRVVSAGGMDRTTFQWKTHGIVEPSKHFRAARKQRQHRQHRQAAARESMRESRTRDSVAHGRGVKSGAAAASGPRQSRRLRQMEAEISRLKDRELQLLAEQQKKELDAKEEKIRQMEAEISRLKDRELQLLAEQKKE